MTTQGDHPPTRDSAGVWLLRKTFVALVSFAVVPGALIASVSLRATPWLFVIGSLAGVLALAYLFRRHPRTLLLFGAAGVAVAAIPLVTDTRGPPFRRDGEQLLFSTSRATRSAYTKAGGHGGLVKLTGSFDQGGCGLQPAELVGKYYRVRDEIVATETGATLTADPQPGFESSGVCTFTFKWSDGEGVFAWSP